MNHQEASSSSAQGLPARFGQKRRFIKVNKKPVYTSLLLTSLVDIMTILVIYLVFNAAMNSQNSNLNDQIKLPSAAQTNEINMSPVLTVDNGHYFLNNQEVVLKNLVAKLKEIKQEITKGDESKPAEIIIQADHQSEFHGLNPILLAGSEAGITKFKFAVVQKEGKK